MASSFGNVKLRVDTTVMLDKAQEAERLAERMAGHFAELEDTISRTGGYWIGEAGDLHRRLYESQKDMVEQILRRLKEHPKDLRQIAHNYGVGVTNVKEIIQDLPENILD